MLALAVGEIMVRGLAPQAIMPNLYTVDPYTGHRLRSDARARHVAHDREFEVDVRTNSHGWRSAELDGRPTVWVLGDSFTFGTGVEQVETFAAVLQDSIDAAANELQVVNSGVGGRTPDQYWAEYHHKKDVTDPSLVIIGFYEGNDFIERSALVSFDGLDKARFASVPPSSSPYAVFRAAIQGPVYDALAQHSHLAVLAKNVLYSIVTSGATDEATRDPHAAFTFRILRGLSAEAAADGVVAVVVIIPRRTTLEPSVDPRTDRLSAILEAHAIPVLDLRDIMHGRRDYYHRGAESHWNSRGHAVAGTALYRFLREKELLDDLVTRSGEGQ